MATIGIRTADGKFYPILDERGRTQKTLTLTPVRSEQEWVEIAFYRSESGTMEDARFTGLLTLDNQKDGLLGGNIKLSVESDGNGSFTPTAENACGRAVFSPSMDETDGGVYANDAGVAPFGLLFDRPKDKPRWLPMVAVVLAVAVLGGSAAFFVLRGNEDSTPTREGMESTALPSPGTTDAEAPPVLEKIIETVQASLEEEPPSGALPSVSDAEPVQTVPQLLDAASSGASDAKATPIPALLLPPTDDGEASVIVAPKLPAPVRSVKAPRPIPAGGAMYVVRWGDTLWDITDVFYGNPWLFKRLASYNKLRYRAVLLPGTRIRIPREL